MGVCLFTNNAKGTLTAAAASTATSLSLQSGQGALFPALSGGDFFYATLFSASLIEVVKCTARTGDLLTVVRGQDGTTAQAFAIGDQLELRLTHAALQLFPQTGQANTWAAAQTFSVAPIFTDASGTRTALALGSAAQASTGTGAGQVPLNSSSNTITTNITGNASGSSGSCTGNAASATTATTATTANAVAAGSVAPAGLSAGHPTWDTSGNFTVPGTAIVGTAGGEMFDTGTSFVAQFRAGCYIQYDSSTHKFVWVIDGVAQMSLDNGGNLRCVGTVIINTAV